MSLDPTVAKGLSEQRSVSYVTVALVLIALYDHFITLDGEIQFIWRRSRWTFIELLFLVNRYLSDAILLYGTITL